MRLFVKVAISNILDAVGTACIVLSLINNDLTTAFIGGCLIALGVIVLQKM